MAFPVPRARSRDNFAADKKAWQEPQKEALRKLVAGAKAAGRGLEWGKWAREDRVRARLLSPLTAPSSHTLRRLGPGARAYGHRW